MNDIRTEICNVLTSLIHTRQNFQRLKLVNNNGDIDVVPSYMTTDAPTVGLSTVSSVDEIMEKVLVPINPFF